jgi:hypothetical protein
MVILDEGMAVSSKRSFDSCRAQTALALPEELNMVAPQSMIEYPTNGQINNSNGSMLTSDTFLDTRNDDGGSLLDDVDQEVGTTKKVKSNSCD